MTLKGIAQYVIEKYPKSCFAQNINEFGYGYVLEDDELLAEELANFFAYDLLHLCGCGIPDNTWEVIRRILRIRSKAREMEYSDILQMYKDELHLDTDDDLQHGSFQFILYVLDHYGLIEHGSSVGGCWLSELGKMYLMVLDAYFGGSTDGL